MGYIISVIVVVALSGGVGFCVSWLRQNQKISVLKDNYEGSIKALTAERSELERESAVVKESFRMQGAELLSVRESLDRECDISNGRNLEIAKLQTQNENLTEKLRTQSEELSVVQRSLEEQQELAGSRKAEIATLIAQKSGLEEKVSTRESEIEMLQTRLSAEVSNVEEQQSLVNQRNMEITVLKSQKVSLEEKLSTRESEIETLQTRLSEEVSNVEELQSQVNKCNVEITFLKSQKVSLEEKLSTQKVEIEELQKRLTSEFENIATRILKERTENFSTVTQRQIGDILNPLKERIKDFEQKVDKTYSEETREKTSLKEQIKHLIESSSQVGEEANRLTKALKGDSKVQGDWGEFQLERLLETTGLQKGIQYTKQENFKTEDGANVRPDFIIQLPDNKQFVIDSKVSLAAYERYFNAEDETERAIHLKKHITSIQNHISDLSSKNYQHLYGINSPDYVFLFVALEPALNLVMHNDPTIFEKAMNKNIVLVSASTLWATMRTVSFIWKQENQNKNARDIAKESGALYDKFTNFIEDLTTLGIQLEKSQKCYDGAMNKLTESTKKGDTIIGRIQKIKDLGANTTKSLPPSLLDRIE
jgi:DNA recombination protein RmuC